MNTRDQLARSMPNEADALRALFDAWCRLRDLGWQDATLCPKDGTAFEVIEPGSTGIHKCIYLGDWPKGSWFVMDAGDWYPSRPILYRPIANHDALPTPPAGVAPTQAAPVQQEPNPPRYSYGPGWVVLLNPEDCPRHGDPHRSAGTKEPSADVGSAAKK